MFSGVHRILACDRRTVRRTDILQQHSPRYALASRVTNFKPKSHEFLNYDKLNQRGNLSADGSTSKTSMVDRL